MNKYLSAVGKALQAASRDPKRFAQLADKLHFRSDAEAYARQYVERAPSLHSPSAPSDNPLWDYFQAHAEGHGIWKWEHYFEIYQRHLGKFVGRDVAFLEIGIYSGGSLPMWRSYFGERCAIYGVDIEEACKAYENDYTSIFIGDQESRDFWQHFRQSARPLDIVIDDGGHTPEQQRVTLEELLPYLRPGGVYVCEDVHGTHNGFAAYASSLVDELNRNAPAADGTVLQREASPFQQSVHSIHFYPYCVVIEKHAARPARLCSLKRGTQWQPLSFVRGQ